MFRATHSKLWGTICEGLKRIGIENFVAGGWAFL
jgi:hypothetical protein